MTSLRCVKGQSYLLIYTNTVSDEYFMDETSYILHCLTVTLFCYEFRSRVVHPCVLLTNVDGSFLLVSRQHPHLDVSLPQPLNGLRHSLYRHMTTHTCRRHKNCQASSEKDSNDCIQAPHRTHTQSILYTCLDSFTLARVHNNLRHFGNFQLPSSFTDEGS